MLFYYVCSFKQLKFVGLVRLQLIRRGLEGMLFAAFICSFSYILGIIISPLVSFPYLTIFALSLIISAFVAKLFFKFRILPILLAVFMMIFGSVRYNIVSKNSLFENFPEKYVEITGVVTSIPKASLSEYKYRYEVDLKSITYLGETYDTHSKILLNSKEDLAYGDIINAWGFLTSFSDASNEFEFNYRLYYKSRGILSRMTALELTKIGVSKSLSPAFLAGKAKYRIYKNMEMSLNSGDFAFGSAVIFGDKSHFDKPYSTLLTRTGVFRILYSPFSHLSVIMIISSLLFARGRKRKICFAIILTLYLIFINGAPLALKAGIITILILISKKMKGYSNKFGIVAFTALLLTLINPLLCFDGGFMMSVISSVLLNVSYRPIYRFLLRFRLIRRFHIASPVALWIILIFGTLPFSAYYFNGVSLYSVLLIPIILPFAALIIFLTPFMFIAKSGLTVILMPVYRLTIFILRLFPVLVSKLPFYYVMLPKPSALKIIFYSLLWWVFIRSIKSKFNTVQTKVLLSAMAGILICIVLDFSVISLGIYFINVGQGDAAVLHTGLGETVIIDGGGSSDYEENYNVGESVFLPYLVSHGFTRIDTAIVSHYHKDHIEGIISAAETLKINTLLLPDCMPENKYRKKLESIAKDRHIKIEYLGLGDEVRFRSGLTLSVIAPDNALIDKDNENDTSLVITVRYGDFSALFTGDFEAEEDITPPYNVDLLKVGHHGSKNANDFEFLHLVSPRIAVISVGKHNRYALPDKNVVSELENLGATVLRTDYLGDIRLKVDKKGNIRYNSFLGGRGYAAKRR